VSGAARRAARAALLAVAAVAMASSAHANAAATYFRNPGEAGGAFLAEPTHLVVEHETLTIDCAEEGARRVCTFLAVYDVANPTDLAEEVLGVFFGAVSGDMTITVDGRDARRAVSRDVVATALRAFGGASPRPSEEPSAGGPSAGFVVQVEGRARKAVRFTGPLRPTVTSHGIGGYTLSAIKTRHMALGGIPRWADGVEVSYLIAPLRTWGGQPAIDITVRFPAAWSFAPEEGGWSETSAGGVRTARLVTTAERTPRLSLPFTVDPPLLVHGGPFGGIGAELEDAGPRVRAGYEVGLGHSTIASLAFESFADRGGARYALVPALEAATPGAIVIVPSLFAGLGVPVRFHASGSPSFGARAQVGLSFPYVSLIVPFDFYVDDLAHPRAALVGQLSF
jgi:hypothetical protein